MPVPLFFRQIINFKKKKDMEIKRSEAIELNRVLSACKVGSLGKDVLFSMIDNKLALSKIVTKMDEARKLAAEETKPEELKDKETTTNKALAQKWDIKFGEYMSNYLQEVESVELKTLTRDEYATIVTENNLSFGDAEVLSVLRV